MSKLSFRSMFDALTGLVRLVRLPNLMMIVLAQLLLRYCIIEPLVYDGFAAGLSPFSDFAVLMAITLLIATGGYVINDYFDAGIDNVNRPEKQVIGRFITRHNAIKVHLLLNGIAILLGAWLAWRIRTISFGLIFPFLAGLLWIYSAKYKRVAFWGNFIVSVLTAFVLVVPWIYEFFWLGLNPSRFSEIISNLGWINRVIMAYALFAFLTSMLRELVKDLEDMEGDRRFDCRTIPIVIGVKWSVRISMLILLATMLLLAWSQVVVFRLELSYLFWYLMITVQFPSLYLLFRLFRACERKDFSFASLLVKIIMIAGIFSMQIIFISL